MRLNRGAEYVLNQQRGKAVEKLDVKHHLKIT